MIFRHFKLTVLALLIAVSASFGQKKIEIKDKIELTTANGDFIAGAYDYAIDSYKKLHSKYPNDAVITYRLAYCLMETGELEEAIQIFETVKAGQLKKKHFDHHFGYGKALQKLAKYNGALAQYKEFQKKGKKSQLEILQVDRFILQCEYAIKAIEAPKSVKIDALGGYINSTYDDYHPMVTIDGKMMVFTSRRSCKKNEELLGDNQYYDKIYFSLWDESAEMWGEAKLMEGRINSKEYDANTGISADGKQLLVYKNISDNNKAFSTKGIGSGDVLISKLGKNNKWGRPKLPEGINSTFYDGGACFSPDGTKMFFISDRAGILYRGSQGGRDIWMSELQSDKTWSKPTNLGELVNSPYDERAVYMHPDGKTLFFSSEGHDDQNMGGYDVFKTEFKNGAWTKAVNLGFPINTSDDEKEFILDASGKTAWISARKNKSNKIDIYQLDMSFYDVVTGKNDPFSIVKGNVSDGSTGLFLNCKITFTNKATGEETTVEADENGEYLATLVSNSTYTVNIAKEGYNLYSKELALALPPKPVKSKRKPRKKRGEVEKSVKTAEIHSVQYNIQIQRTVPLKIVNKDLFKTKTLRFVNTADGYQLDDFSKTILSSYIEQATAEPAIKLHLMAHFDDESEDEEVSLGKSNNLAKIVLDQLKDNNVDMDKVIWYAMGNTQPMANSDTEADRKINTRVEIKILL